MTHKSTPLTLDWQSRLSSIEAELKKDHSPLCWRAKAQAKVLRFLIARYGFPAVYEVPIPSAEIVGALSIPESRPSLTPSQRLQHLSNIAEIVRSTPKTSSLLLQCFDDSIQAGAAQSSRERCRMNDKPRN